METINKNFLKDLENILDNNGNLNINVASNLPVYEIDEKLDILYQNLQILAREILIISELLRFNVEKNGENISTLQEKAKLDNLSNLSENLWKSFVSLRELMEVKYIIDNDKKEVEKILKTSL